MYGIVFRLQFFVVLGYVVQPNYFASALKELPMFYDKTYVKEFQSVGLSHTPAYLGFPELVMP